MYIQCIKCLQVLFGLCGFFFQRKGCVLNFYIKDLNTQLEVFSYANYKVFCFYKTKFNFSLTQKETEKITLFNEFFFNYFFQ